MSQYDEYVDIKNCSYEKRLIGKLILECEEKILNSNEALLDDKKYHMQKVIALFILFHWYLYVCYYEFSCVLVVIFILQNIKQNKKMYYHLMMPSLN